MIIEILLVAIIALLLFLIITKKDIKDADISPYLIKVLNDSGLFTKIGELSGHAQNLTLSTQNITNNVQDLTGQTKDINNTLTIHAQNLTNQAKDINETLNKRVGEMNETLDKKVGELTVQAEDIRNAHKSVEQMLRIPKERAPIGEIGLEVILSDQLPPDMFGIRQKILDGKIPDAYIKSTSGTICIDSKFPLDNYVKMVEAKDPVEKESFKTRFIKDVEGHIKKISLDYINPQKGSADFAFAYIPSEGVYYFLVNEAYDMLRSYATKGVILAFGTVPRELGILGEAKFLGRGLSTCTTCDAPLFKNKIVAVIGGGNSAVEGALELAKIGAKQVYLVHRRNEFRADEITMNKIKKNKKIELVTPYEPVEIVGDKFVSALKIRNPDTKEEKSLALQGIFKEIGFVVDVSAVKHLVKINEKNEVIIDGRNQTSVQGIFAAGDVTTVPYKQAVISAGEGAKAALACYQFISGQKEIGVDWEFKGKK